MVRIRGIDLPAEKKIVFALPKIFGIGLSLAQKICAETKVDPQKKVKELSPEEISKIDKFIEANYKVEGDLRREIKENIKRLIEIQCYRGIRHQKGLPVRGQRTRSNARTRKGPRKTVATGARRKAGGGKR
ncbi:MAG: 30S ribosomal protein S13 [Candidatus Parcubacteria bacterium]|nr:MAG: 30S ribosomal protein S13 [Candidatus Parcubacteria bacterium]